jgi:hypothetical protein
LLGCKNFIGRLFLCLPIVACYINVRKTVLV